MAKLNYNVALTNIALGGVDLGAPIIEALHASLFTQAYSREPIKV